MLRLLSTYSVKLLSVFAAASAVSAAHAGGALDISLSESSVRVEHDAVVVGSRAHYTAGVWYHKDNGYALALGFNAVDNSHQNNELITGVGVKGFLFEAENEKTAFAAGIGGFVRYQPDFAYGFGGEVQGYYAPDVTSFNDSESFYELHLRATYQIVPQARAFIGWQEAVAEFDGEREELDSTLVLGFRLNY